MLQSDNRRVKMNTSGFTLIELVVVIIVLGVLSVTALPKLITTSAFADYTVRDQLISRLRLVQLQAMNADPADNASDNACYWLVVKSTCFYHEHSARSAGSCALPSAEDVCSDPDYNQYNSVSFSDNMLTAAKYRFDIDGRLTTDSDSSSITINGDNNLMVTIESQGYIHEATQ